MPMASTADLVWTPCRCGGRLPSECGLRDCPQRSETRLERIAALNGMDADELRAEIYLEIHRRTQSD